jgi:hypothetical protein
VTKIIRGTGVLAVCLVVSLTAAGETVRLVPVFRAGAIYEISNTVAHDLDGDGRAELVACSSGAPVALSARNGGYEVTWRAAAAGCSAGVAAGDIDGDGGAEVITAYAKNVMFFDPRGLSGPTRIVTIPGSNSITALALGNVDDDAAPEVVVVTGGTTYVYDGATLELQWTAGGYGGDSVAIGDVDGDSRREIVVNGSTAYVLDGAAETQKWGYVGGFSDVWALGNVDADSKDEIVFRMSGVTILNGDTFTMTSWANSYVDALAVADANDDGANEIVVGSYYNDTSGRNPVTGAELWKIESSYNSVTGVGAAELDGDAAPEVFWWNNVTFYVGGAAAPTPEWKSLGYYDRYHSAFGDLDGDGRLEYVVASFRTSSDTGGGTIRIFDAETHALLGTLTPGSYSAYVNEVAIGQLDGDPALEVAALIGYYGNTLVTWDGVTKQQEFSSNPGGTTLGPAMHIANIDADAVDEIILGTSDQHVLVLNGASNIIQKSLAITGSVADFALADLNGDTSRDLVVGGSAGLTVYDTTSWAVLGSQAMSYVSKIDATAADGGTVAATSEYYYSDFRVFKGAALTSAYTCNASARVMAFADVAGEERLIVADQTGNLRLYPLDGDACPEELEPVFAASSITDLTALDVTGDGRQDLILDGQGASAVALLGVSSETRGDVDGDGVITSDDIDDAVDYLFGAQPGISPSADATADQRISPEDLFHLIDYEFAGGAAPQP